MGKDKLRRFAEMATFKNVFEPRLEESLNKDYKLKGLWGQEFGNNNPIVLELACGKGEFTVAGATRSSEHNFIGIDIKGNRMHRGAKYCLDNGLNNARFLRTRIDFITSFFATAEVSDIWIIFPDPQPQKNRARKRLTGPMFTDRYKQVLKPGGFVHLKTDNANFYAFTMEMIERQGFKVDVCNEDLYGQPRDSRIDDKVYETQTHYERLFLAEGKKMHYVRFQIH